MASKKGVRRNFALVIKESTGERDRFIEALHKLKREKFYPDGYSYWDKQEQIHKRIHIGGLDVHDGSAFLPWHREIINRFEKLLRDSNGDDLALHYWDWTTDPRTGFDQNLFTSDFMGSAKGDAGKPLEDFHSTEHAVEDNGHKFVWRELDPGPPSTDKDDDIIYVADNARKDLQYSIFLRKLQDSHNIAHDYVGGSINNPDYSFEDPFVFLIHSNVDRLFARWQTQPGFDWRTNPAEIYGVNQRDPPLKDYVHPWAGLTRLRPWAEPDNQQDRPPKKFTDISIVTPPLYDTNGT